MVRRISSPVFVGRSSELAALDAVLARAVGGDGSAVLVEGEAGIGKSRLMAQLESRARAAGLSVMVGECLPLAEGELAFAPIVAALRSVMLDSDALAGLEPTLRAALGALWPVAGSEPRHPGDREQLFEAVYRVLADLAARRPVLLIVEDVHWVDPSSRDLMSFIVHNARHDRLVVVATYRPDELHRGHPLRSFVAELERSGRAERLELGGLDRAEVAEQIGAITGGQAPGGTIDAIYARSDGNPFFVEELLATASRGAGLPSSLREALLLRVTGLSGSAQVILSAAAAIGRSVDHRLLASVAGGSERDLLASLREASEHHVLLGTGDCYRFRHALLREAIYEDTLPGERLRLHRLSAETLTARPELAGDGASVDAELAGDSTEAGPVSLLLSYTCVPDPPPIVTGAAIRCILGATNPQPATVAFGQNVVAVRPAFVVLDALAATGTVAADTLGPNVPIVLSIPVGATVTATVNFTVEHPPPLMPFEVLQATGPAAMSTLSPAEPRVGVSVACAGVRRGKQRGGAHAPRSISCTITTTNTGQDSADLTSFEINGSPGVTSPRTTAGRPPAVLPGGASSHTAVRLDVRPGAASGRLAVTVSGRDETDRLPFLVGTSSDALPAVDSQNPFPNHDVLTGTKVNVRLR